MTALDIDWADQPVESPAERPPVERGRTDVASVALQHIAERAATEVKGVHGVRRSGLARVTGGDERAVHVEASVLGEDTARLRVEVALRYPNRLRAVLEQLRAHLIERVEELSGYRVEELDIVVVELSAFERSRRVR